MQNPPPLHDVGVQNLRLGIIRQAMNDYENALNGGYSHPGKIPPDVMQSECEAFFKSDWCNLLTGGIDGKKIIEVEHLKARYIAWRKEHECGKCKVKYCIHRDGQHFTAIETGDLFCKKGGKL